MPNQLLPFTIHNPGNKGLNTQDSTQPLDAAWAAELENTIFDEGGRITSRQGWTKLTTSSTFGAHDLEQVHCWENATSTVVIVAGNNKILTGTTTLVDKTAALTFTANNWQFQNWIDADGATKILAWQAGHAPVVSTVSTVTPGDFAAIVAGTGTVPAGNCALVAYGRVWATDADNFTIKYSGLLNETLWSSGGAGSFNTQHYWPKGTDYVTAIAAWENRLVVFGKRNILVYDNPANIGSFPLLTDTIEGVGCVARDSVQVIGSDILFLSETGLRSLRRTFETEKNPLQEVAIQVRDRVISYIPGNEAKIRSVYNQAEGFYLLVIPDANDPVVFMYDAKSTSTRDLFGRQMFDLSSMRVSIWHGWNATGVAFGRNNVMYGGFRDSTDADEGVVGWYRGFLDNTSTYTFSYWSPWMDYSQKQGEEGGDIAHNPTAFYKIIKSITATVLGGSGYTVTVRWGYDYSSSFDSATFSIPDSGIDSAEWNVSEWGIGEWGFRSTSVVTRDRVQGSNYGDTFRIGMSCRVNEDPISLQRLDVFMKPGRISR